MELHDPDYDDWTFATECLDCGAIFYEGEEGWDCEECFECGGNTAEVLG